MDLARALRASSTPIIAFVGAGGKSTALFQLAHLLSGPQHLPVLVTATSHLHVDQINQANSHWIGHSPADLAGLEEHLQGVLLVTGPVEQDRTTGITDEVAAWLRELGGYHDIHLLIEADGSRQHPLKAPAAHEPPIPDFVGQVVVVAGLSAIGQPLTAKFVHRPEIFSELTGLPMGSPVTPEALASLLVHPFGGLKKIPSHTRKTILLNQADTPETQALAAGLARQLIPPFDAVVAASLSSPARIHAAYEPIAAVILAAGEASRFGQPKQIVDYRGQPFVRNVALAALSAGLSPVTVVTGAHAVQVEAALQGLPLTLVRNEAWQDGQSTSLRAGLQALPANTGACIFLLADQPQVTPTIIIALAEQHRRELFPIAAPQVAGRRANPVLFDRMTFPDLQALTGDVGGRALFSKYPPHYIEWLDESLLIDIDTPADLDKLKDIS